MPLIFQSYTQPSVGWLVHSKRGGRLYNNQTLIKQAVALPEMHALKWLLLVRYKRKKMQGRIGNQREVTAARLWLWISPSHGVMLAEEKACKIKRITRQSGAFLWSSLHRHDIFSCNTVCLHYDSAVKSSTHLGCKQSICSNIGKHIALSKLKGHSII